MSWSSVPDCYLSQDYGYSRFIKDSSSVDRKFRSYFEEFQNKFGAPRCGTTQAAFLSPDGWVYKVVVKEHFITSYCSSVMAHLGDTSALFTITVPDVYLTDDDCAGNFFVVLPLAETHTIAYGVHKQRLVHPLSEEESVEVLTELVCEQIGESVKQDFFTSELFLHDFIREELDGGQIGICPVSGEYAIFDF